MFLAVRDRVTRRFGFRWWVSEAKISGLAANGLLQRAKRVQGMDLFERYLWVLYRFRSAYFHGDLDPEKSDIQELARNAYDSLREITAPELG